MIPIFGMAAVALLIAVLKWISFMLVGKPSKKGLKKLLTTVAKGDIPAAEAAAQEIRGPVGRMLAVGVEHIHEPRELIEEVMYERMLTTRLKLQSFLPFIAICAASAPLLGLLGTVSGIINTFKMITVFGSGDVKSLSGGISEALITTKFGLIVAIPSLLIHAFLARRAKSMVGQMESSAVGFMNQVAKTPPAKSTAPARSVDRTEIDPGLVRAQVQEILKDLLGDGAPGHPVTVDPVGETS
jgi:biopolymer transport protein ExbB